MDTRQWLDSTDVRRAFDAVAVGVTVHDREGRLVHANRAGLELFGWTEAGEISLAELTTRLQIHSAAANPVAPEELPVALVLAGRESAEAELSVRTPHGARRALRATARRLADPAGQQLVGVVQTFFDNGEAASARGTMRDLVEQSTPVLSVGTKLLLQPLIGTLDSTRAARAMERLLETIGTTGARVAIVDITGVSAVDTATANHLLRSLTAARLLGCEVVLSGVSPPIARTITLLGLDLSALRTKRDVAAAIEFGRRWVEATDAVNAGDAANRAAETTLEATNGAAAHANGKPPAAT